jgi:hypothetical protein
LVARSLHETRRLAAQRLDSQVAQISDELALDHPEWARLIDRKALRGVPFVGRGLGGALQGTQPGSGQHLDELDGV